MNEDKLPLLKRLDLAIFQRLEQWRQTSGYSKLLEAYTALEEGEQQGVKAGLLGALLLAPLLLLGSFWWRNSSIASEIRLRSETAQRMQEIIAQNGAAGNLLATVAAPNALLDQGSLEQRLSSALSSAGIDLGKLRVSGFSSDQVSPALTRAEADFKFEGLNTPQLVSLFTTLLSQERFRVSAVQITRNASNELLDGTFHGVHFGQVMAAAPEEE